MLSKKTQSLAPTRIQTPDRPARPSTRVENFSTQLQLLGTRKRRLTLFLTRSYNSRISVSNLGGIIGYPDNFLVFSVSASMHIPGKSLGYVTSASFDILNSFANDPTRAVQNSGHHFARVTDPCPEARNFYGSSVRNMLHLTFLAPRILRWFLDFWKIYVSLVYKSASYVPKLQTAS
jgi:hypothetical protein